MKELKILPFYMTYPLPTGYTQDKEMVRDLEYFQQLYPMGAKMLQKQIMKSIDILDYEGSSIYDEYPDRMMLQRMARDVLSSMKKEDNEKQEEMLKLLANENIEDYILLLILYEILRRRHKNERGYLLF